MRTHLGCTGRVDLGVLRPDTQRRLEQVEATWLEFSPEPPSLVVRHVQPDDTPALREITGELLEFLSDIPEAERIRIPGGALYYLDETTGQYVRLRVWSGGFLTVAWARPDYAHASWELYKDQKLALVFDAYQCLNGTVRLQAPSSAADEIRSVVDRFGGLYPQGDFETRVSGEAMEIQLRDVNTSVLPLLKILRAKAAPLASLEGEVEVSSFRPGDVEDYCRFALRRGEIWVVRPSLWSDVPETRPSPPGQMEPAA
jgi:hypothetical protein